MSDTPNNQDVYPQHGNQQPGCGFPIARLVVMFSLTTGALVSLLIGVWKTSELVLARQLYAIQEPGDVAVADQLFGTYRQCASDWGRGGLSTASPTQQ